MSETYVEVPFAVPEKTLPARVDVFLAQRLRGYSRSRVQRMIAERRVWLGARAAKPSARVSAGERVTVRFPWRPDPPSKHERLEVIYEDDSLLAINKPGDILSHPTDKVSKASAVWILRRQFPELKPCLIHRLDRETSGVLLFGKGRTAAGLLCAQFESRSMRKEYWAVVRGAPAFRRKVVDQALGGAGHEIRVRQTVTSDGQPARTVFSVLAEGARASLVRAVPRTGRMHQIRVHLAWLGYPVVGDKVYTGQGEAYLKAWRGTINPEDIAALGAGRQMLHARLLEFRHPVTGSLVRLEAPLPDDFSRCMKDFGLSARKERSR